jgi:hypothetical protein
MPFDIQGARKEGYSDSEITEFLAKENRFDLQGARKEGYSDSEILSHLTGTKAPTGYASKEEFLSEGVKPPQREEPGIGAKVLGAGEAGLSILSSMPATVAGSVAGIAKGLAGGKLGTPEGVREAGETASEVSKGLTYTPKTEAGQEALGKVSEAVGASKIAGAPIGDISMMGAMGAAKPRIPEKAAASLTAKDATLIKAREAGYILPPAMAKPSMINNFVEGLAGKLKTAQKASYANQEVTNSLVKKALGLSEDAPLNADTLQAIRQQAGQSYEAVKGTGRVIADKSYFDRLDTIAKPYKQAAKDFPGAANTQVADLVEAMKRRNFDSASAVDQIANLREMADKAYRTGDKPMGRAIKAASNALEDQLGRHLQRTGKPELLDQFRHAREIIAKSYSVQSALNESTGNVSAKTLAQQLKKGRPLSGELKTVGKSAQDFEKAFQDPSKIGSPTSVSVFDVGGAALVGELMHKPWLLAGMLGRPGLRSAMLSKPGQGAMIGTPGESTSLLRSAIENPEMLGTARQENQ